MTNYGRHTGLHPDQAHDALPPPNLARGPIAWVRENLFSSIPNTILTLVVLYLLYVIVPPLAKFLFIDAVWTGADRDACRPEVVGHPVGACWAFVADKINYFIYGSYPVSERWRVEHLVRAPGHRRRLAPVAEGAAQGPRRGLLLHRLPDRGLHPARRERAGSASSRFRPPSGAASS